MSFATLEEANDGYAALEAKLAEQAEALTAAVERIPTPVREQVSEIDTFIETQLKDLDFVGDPENSTKRLAETVKAGIAREVNANKDKQANMESIGNTIRKELKGDGLDEYYEDLFLPTLDSKWKSDPSFRAKSDKQQYAEIVDSMKNVIGKAREGYSDSVEQSPVKGSQFEDALKQSGVFSGMGKGPSNKPTRKTEEYKPRSMKDDFKQLREQQRGVLKQESFR